MPSSIQLFSFSKWEVSRWICFFLVVTGEAVFSLPSQERGKLIFGNLIATGQSKGRHYFTMEEDQSHRKVHILCDEKSVKRLTSLEKDSPRVHLRVRNPEPTSPLLECVTSPQVRPSQSLSSSGSPQRQVIGQVLDADPESGLVSVQSARSKSYLKLSPEIARDYKRRLQELEKIEINDNYTYDRNLGYYRASHDKD